MLSFLRQVGCLHKNHITATIFWWTNGIDQIVTHKSISLTYKLILPKIILQYEFDYMIKSQERGERNLQK